MVRGLIFGTIWGGLFTGLFLAVISLLAPMPDRNANMAEAEPVAAIEEPMADTQPSMPIDDVTPTPEMVSPSVEDAPELGETTSAIMPSTGQAESSLDVVSEANESAPAVSTGDQPSLASVQSDAPLAPSVENELSISVDPAQPSMPDAQEETLAALVEEVPVASTEPKTLMLDTPLESDSDVVTNRLPAVASSVEEAPAEVMEVVAKPQDDRPLMAIVLIDTGEFNIGPEALASFPYPITFAIDPFREDALETATNYRSEGFELLITADLPANGDKSLADLALVPTVESIPGVVGVLEGTETGLQGNMQLAEGVLDAVEDAGFGLVLRAKGLNAAQQQADGRDLPVETLFRDFDGAGQNASVIRRFLDQAAFKARQEGSVIMVGRLRPATISALLLWGLQDRATSVSLTPISDVLAQ